MPKVTHKVGDYYITKPVWESKLSFLIEIAVGIVIIAWMLFERTVN